MMINGSGDDARRDCSVSPTSSSTACTAPFGDSGSPPDVTADGPDIITGAGAGVGATDITGATAIVGATVGVGAGIGAAERMRLAMLIAGRDGERGAAVAA